MGGLGSGRGWRRAARGWLPLASILVAYRLLHGASEPLSARAHVEPQRGFDDAVFGGSAPTVSLQRAFWDADDPRWWDYAAWAVYHSHFVVTPALAAVLWRRDERAFLRYRTLVLTGAMAGFATYVAYPAIPPWLASTRGDLPPTDRVVRSIWDHLGAPRIAAVFGEDSELAFPVGALPSLHAAAPFLAMLFLWDRAPRTRPALVAYNAAMAGTLVYSADHFVFDILLGWGYALVVHRALDSFWRRSSVSRGRAAPGGNGAAGQASRRRPWRKSS
jgi:hypothetical protein